MFAFKFRSAPEQRSDSPGDFDIVRPRAPRTFLKLPDARRYVVRPTLAPAAGGVALNLPCATVTPINESGCTRLPIPVPTQLGTPCPVLRDREVEERRNEEELRRRSVDDRHSSVVLIAIFRESVHAWAFSHYWQRIVSARHPRDENKNERKTARAGNGAKERNSARTVEMTGRRCHPYRFPFILVLFPASHPSSPSLPSFLPPSRRRRCIGKIAKLKLDRECRMRATRRAPLDFIFFLSPSQWQTTPGFRARTRLIARRRPETSSLRSSVS